MIKLLGVIVLSLLFLGCSDDNNSETENFKSVSVIDGISRADYVKLDSNRQREVWSVLSPETKTRLWIDKFENEIKLSKSKDEKQFLSSIIKMLNDGFAYIDHTNEQFETEIKPMLDEAAIRLNWSQDYLAAMFIRLEDQAFLMGNKRVIYGMKTVRVGCNCNWTCFPTTDDCTSKVECREARNCGFLGFYECESYCVPDEMDQDWIDDLNQL